MDLLITLRWMVKQVRFRRGNEDFITIKPEDAEVTDLLIENEIPVRAEQQQQSGFQTFLVSLLPFLLLIGVWVFFMNRMQGGGKGGAMGFGKSKAKMLTEKNKVVSLLTMLPALMKLKKSWRK